MAAEFSLVGQLIGLNEFLPLTIRSAIFSPLYIVVFFNLFLHPSY